MRSNFYFGGGFLKTKQKKQLLSLVEAAILMALAVVLDYLCKLIPFQFPYGGGISISVLPLIYYTFRRGTTWGLGAGVVFSVLQIITGWYPPPAGTWWAFVLCILLDYLLAFSLLRAPSDWVRRGRGGRLSASIRVQLPVRCDPVGCLLSRGYERVGLLPALQRWLHGSQRHSDGYLRRSAVQDHGSQDPAPHEEKSLKVH